MRIGIFADRIGSKGGGLETYERELIKGFMEIDSRNEYIIFGCSHKAIEKSLGRHPRFTFMTVSKNSKFLRLSMSLPFKLMKNHLDLVHVCMVPPLFCPKEFIFTVHDLASFIHPEFFPKKILYRANLLLEKGIKQATKIIAVSEATKRDVIRLFGIDPNKIVVIHHGIDSQYKPLEDKKDAAAILKKYGISDKYILYVGRIQARKNISRLIRAFQLLKQKTKLEHKLVLVGKMMWESKEFFKEIDNLNIREDVIMTDHVSYSDLPYFYNNADAFIYASLFEGFGLPPLEAMACGTPAVVSNVTAIPEVVGDAALFVNPYDIFSIAEGMEKLLSSDNLKKELIKKGFQRAKQFSWKETAKKTLSVYEQEL